MKNFFVVVIALFAAFNYSAAQQEMDTIKIKEEDIEAARRVRRVELNDPIRPSWHLTIPEGVGFPFDPNGAIFKDDVYHLWYLYQDGSAKWQHLSSIDLFHWRWHPNNLQSNPGDADAGSNSGNAFVAGDGNIVMSYNGIGTAGNCVAYSEDKDLNHWVKPKANPIASPGWDPHMWYETNTYYQISGGIPLWDDGKPNPPLLFKGSSYKEKMERVGNFMKHDMPGIDSFEDVSCPDFFKMDDKWVLICISHKRGARYYIGEWNGTQFKPEYHHRMNWPGGTFFAPETLLDNKGRRILWAWVLDRKSGVSSGSMSMPRVLTMAKDKKSLLFGPPKEIELLRYAPQIEKPFTVAVNQPVTLKKTQGNSLEMNIVIDPGKARRFGLKVFCSADEREQTPIVVDLDKKTLQIDMRKSSLHKVDYKEFVVMKDTDKRIETLDAPFELKKGEMLNLRIFLDKSMLEVFANGRQCMTQVVYPSLKDAINVQLFTEDGYVTVKRLQSWKLFPAMQW